MKKWLALLIFSVSSVAFSQRAAISGYCDFGASKALTSNLPSSNYQQQLIPRCLVTVYLTGTTTKAAIFKDGSGTALTNAFQANPDASWIFFAAINQGYDVVLSGPPTAVAPNVYPLPRTITGVYPAQNIVTATGATGPIGPTGPTGPPGPATNLHSPGPIGDATPGTGNFVTVAAGASYTTVSAGLATAAEALLPSGGTLIGNNILTVPATHSTPANISFDIQKGGGFNISSGQVLSILGPLTAGRYQIFFGTGTVSFTSNANMKELYPEWWGAVPNAESTAAWQAAITAANNINSYGGTVSCPNAIYNISNTLTSYATSAANGVSLLGPESQNNAAGGACSLKWTGVAGGTMFHYLGGHYGKINGINFDGNFIAGRDLWLDTSNGSSATSSSIVSISRTSNVTTVQTGTAQAWVSGNNLKIAGVTDTSFNGIWTVWYPVDSTHYVFSQSGPDTTSSGGTAGTFTGADTGQLLVQNSLFWSPQSQIVSVSSCTIINTPQRLSCTLAGPAIMYPNQWIWITGATGALGPNYNAYWKVYDVQSATQFTANSDFGVVDAVGISGTGTFYSPSTCVSWGSNVRLQQNYSVYGTIFENVGCSGFSETFGGNTVWPLMAYEFDGTNNTKDFTFKDTTAAATRIGWGAFATGGNFECGGCGGVQVQDAMFVAKPLGVINIHDGEWEQQNGSYVFADLISGAYNGTQLGTTGQFEYPAGSSTGSNLTISGVNFSNWGFAPDGVVISTAVNTTLIGNQFISKNNFASSDVVNAVALATAGTGGTPGIVQITGVGGCTTNARGGAGNAIISLTVNAGGDASNNVLILDKGGNCTSAPTFTVPGSTATFNVTEGTDITYLNAPTVFGGGSHLTSIGNNYWGVPSGGYIPVITRSSALTAGNPVTSAYGPNVFSTVQSAPVISLGDNTSNNYSVSSLSTVTPASIVRYSPPPVSNPATKIINVQVTGGVAIITLDPITPRVLVPYQLVTASGLTSIPGICLNGKLGTVIATGLTVTTVQYKTAVACTDAGPTADSGTLTINAQYPALTGMIQAPNNFPIIASKNSSIWLTDNSLRFDTSDKLVANILNVDYQIPYMVAGLMQVANLPLGTNAAVGAIKCDGTTITCTAGVIATKTLSATTPSIGGTLLAVGCTNQAPVTVTGATTAMGCVMSGVAGNPANVQPQCSVTSANTVTPQLCAAVAVTPVAQTYNLRVIP